MKYLSYFFIYVLLFASCKSQPTVTTGISGKVVWVEGNQMPGPDMPRTEPKPVQRTIVICQVANMNELKGNAPLFELSQNLILKSVESDKSGNFRFEMPPGTYSLFTKEEGGYFANSFDGQSRVNPVKVTNGEVSDLLIKVDYKASY